MIPRFAGAARLLVAVAAGSLCQAAPLAAQWRVGVDAGLSRFTGASLDTSSGGTSVRPHAPALLGLRVERGLGRLGVGLGIWYASTGVVADAGSVAVLQRDIYSLVEFAPEVWVRIARTGTGTELRVHAGPVLDAWGDQGGGGGSRTRGGGQAALSVSWPILGRFEGSIRAAAALTSSVWADGEPPAPFATRAMWRQSVSLGLRYRP